MGLEPGTFGFQTQATNHTKLRAPKLPYQSLWLMLKSAKRNSFLGRFDRTPSMLEELALKTLHNENDGDL